MIALVKNLLSTSALVAMIFAVLFIPTATAADKLAQDKQDKKQEQPPDLKKLAKADKSDKGKSDREKNLEKLTAEQLAEVVIIAYGGRTELQQVRTSGNEDGNIKLTAEDKDIVGRITRKFLRKDNAAPQDLTRIDVELPTQKLTFGFNGFTVWAARDGVNFTPSGEAETSFLASLEHNYDALLRYKEQGSTLERAGMNSIVGIDTEVLDLTHKDGSKTRYFISAKTYRILHLEYELKLHPDEPATKFRESFFDFRPIQNTLVPTKSILFENGKQIQEIQITQAKYHANLEEEQFLKYQ